MSGRRQVALVLTCALAGALLAILVAQQGRAASGEDPPPTTTTPTTTAPEPVIADGVTVAGIEVSGLTADAATSVIRTAFAAPLTIRTGTVVLTPAPTQLGATAYVPAAVAKALAAPPNTSVTLSVHVAGAKVRAYVDLLAKRFNRRAVDSRILLRGLRPFVTKQRPGIAVRKTVATTAIVRALTHNDRLPMLLPTSRIAPTVTRANIGPIIVIQRESKWLNLYKGMAFVRHFRIATGMPQYPTPLGRFQILVKWENPWWYPPNSGWAKGAKPIPPGPGNPLGTRWMGLSAPGVGIHGTPDAASLGYSLSHGCIRMAIPEAEWLFNRVRLGTTVFIIPK